MTELQTGKKSPCSQVISPSVSSNEELKQLYLTCGQKIKRFRDRWNDRYYQVQLLHFTCNHYRTTSIPGTKSLQEGDRGHLILEAFTQKHSDKSTP